MPETNQRLRVLLVEDNAGDALLLRLKLTEIDQPVEIAQASSLQQALALLAAIRAEGRPMDAVLLDLFLSDSAGLETLQRVLQAAPDLPVVVLTGLDDREKVVQAMQAGAQDYLVKGQVEPDGLLRTIQYAIYRKQAQAEQQRLLAELKRSHDELEQRVRARTADLARTIDNLQQEVQDRLRAEQTLRESEQRFRQMAEGLPQVFWMSNADLTQTLYVNPMFQQVWQVPPDRLYADPVCWVQTVHPEDRRPLLAKVTRAMQSPDLIRQFDEEFRIARPDGTQRRIRARAFPVLGEDGQVRRICGLCEDVTDLRLADAARTRLAAIVQSSRDAIIAASMDGRILSWNQSACRLFGYRPEQAIGQPLSFHVPPGRKDEVPWILQTIRRGGRVESFETIRLRRSGKPLHVSITASAVREPTGSTVSLIIRDISQMRRLQQEVLRAGASERQRIGRDLHDSLGQVLAGLGLLSQALQGRLDKKALTEARLAADISSMAGQAADTCRSLAQGLCPVEITSHGLPAGLKELAERTEARYGISCGFACPRSVELETGIANELYLIAQEAVANAVRHAQARQILIELRQSSHALVLCVRDDGTGLPPRAERRKGMGIRIMRHRASMIGAVLRLLPGPRGGNQVICTLHTPPSLRPRSHCEPGTHQAQE